MKIALLTDTHYGIRNDNPIFIDYTEKFLNDIFFPYLEKNNITTLIHLGDIVDRRKYINYLTLNRLRNEFLEPLAAKNIETHIIAGNHDVYHKNTNIFNSLHELIGDKYLNIKTYIDPTVIKIDNVPITLVPWINDENRETTLKLIQQKKSDICLGHLELIGFEMDKNNVSTHGDDGSIFSKFDLVCSGHYHHKSTLGNINYLGCHCEFTWADYEDPKGFHILDLHTKELTFIENPYTIFKKIWYDDLKNNYSKDTIDYSRLSNKMVKIIVKNKNNPYWFDLVVDRIEKAGAFDIQVVEDNLNLINENDDSIIDEAEDTITIFKNYIEKTDLDEVTKNKLNNLMSDLYTEALSVS